METTMVMRPRKKQLVFKGESSCTTLKDNEVYSSVKVGNMKFALHNFREVEGHDDTFPYVGDLFCNGEKICHCFNDGWGGTTSMEVYNKSLFNFVKEKVMNYKWKDEKYPYEITLTIDFIADTLACCKQ